MKGRGKKGVEGRLSRNSFQKLPGRRKTLVGQYLVENSIVFERADHIGGTLQRIQDGEAANRSLLPTVLFDLRSVDLLFLIHVAPSAILQSRSIRPLSIAHEFRDRPPPIRVSGLSHEWICLSLLCSSHLSSNARPILLKPA